MNRDNHASRPRSLPWRRIRGPRRETNGRRGRDQAGMEAQDARVPPRRRRRAGPVEGRRRRPERAGEANTGPGTPSRSRNGGYSTTSATRRPAPTGRRRAGRRGADRNRHRTPTRRRAAARRRPPSRPPTPAATADAGGYRRRRRGRTERSGRGSDRPPGYTGQRNPDEPYHDPDAWGRYDPREGPRARRAGATDPGGRRRQPIVGRLFHIMMLLSWTSLWGGCGAVGIGFICCTTD